MATKDSAGGWSKIPVYRGGYRSDPGKITCRGANPRVWTEFLDENVTFEGKKNFLYLDILGLITTGVGNMLDAKDGSGWKNALNQVSALPEPRFLNGGTMEQFKREWELLKKEPKTTWAKDADTQASLTKIRFTDAAIIALVKQMFDSNDRFLIRMFGNEYCDWPVGSQKAVHNMLWALGQQGFETKFPKMIGYLAEKKWECARKEAQITEIFNGKVNDKVRDRNVENARLLSQAATETAAKPKIEPVVSEDKPPKSIGSSGDDRRPGPLGMVSDSETRPVSPPMVMGEEARPAVPVAGGFRVTYGDWFSIGESEYERLKKLNSPNVEVKANVYKYGSYYWQRNVYRAPL